MDRLDYFLARCKRIIRTLRAGRPPRLLQAHFAAAGDSRSGADMPTSSSRVSRRRLLKAAGVAAVGGGSAALLRGGDLAAQRGTPAILANTQAGRKFKAFVK